MIESDIKVTDLEYYKVGTDDCEIYLGETKLYPLSEPVYDTQYLTFRVASSGYVGWSGSTTANTLSYSTDSGSTWSTPSSSFTVNVNVGSTVMWKGQCVPVDVTSGIGSFHTSPFVSEALVFSAEGNIMSLLFGDNFSGQTSLSGLSGAFSELFDNTYKLANAKNLKLPATTLSNYCYSNMFHNCNFLATAPELPATELQPGCYHGMFAATAIVSAPELPATTLVAGCYENMFKSCFNLTKSPLLPASTVQRQSYYNMFSDCTSLNEVTCLATNISAVMSTTDWLYGVASTGTFYKDPNMTSWTSGASGIPDNWTVHDY